MSHTSMVRSLNPIALFGGRTMPALSVVPEDNPQRLPNSRSARARAANHRGTMPEQSSREWNPTTGMWLLIAGGTAVLVGGAIALYSRKSHAATPPGTVTPPGGGEVPGGGGGTPHHGTKNYVGGDPNYSWPHRDTFPDESNFIITLGQFGYNVNYNKGVLGWENMVAVRNFQIDYNKVQQLADLTPAPSGPIGVDNLNLSQFPGVPPGKKGGYIGNQTVNAMYNALQWTATQSWDDLKQEAAGL